ncbi:MAG: 50S ribosomal protein L15 [Candidatus Peregrinibacteria bacterium]
MQLHSIHPKSGSVKSRKRLGRGNASGHGTFSGRGCKGQGQHGGKNPTPGFEGGQTPLARRLPKLGGFKNPSRVSYQIVNVRDLERFDHGTEITPAVLLKEGIIRQKHVPVKLLGEGKLTKKSTVKLHAYSRSAKDLILRAGGKIL